MLANREQNILSDFDHLRNCRAVDIKRQRLMQMACKSAIKGGDDLSKGEIELLLKEMQEQNVVLFCPHGRPVIVRITKSEIEKWFKRIV
jgi:DNA mismatch repair protein MutL